VVLSYAGNRGRPDRKVGGQEALNSGECLLEHGACGRKR